MEFDIVKAIDLGINVLTIIVSALVIYNRLSNRMSLMEQKFDILTGSGFQSKEAAAAAEKRLDSRIDDLRASISSYSK